MKTTSIKRKPEPQEPRSPLVPLESLEDIAWELWLLIELLAPVRRRLPNTASQRLVDYGKDRLIAKSVALAKWTKGPPGIVPRFPNWGSGRVARRELDLPGPPDFGGCDRGRANFSQGTLE